MVGNNLDKMKRKKKNGKGWEGGDTCLLGIAGKCTVKASVHVPVKGKKYESPAPEPVIKDGKEEIICLLDGEREVSMQKQEVIPGGWNSQGEVSIIQYEPDPVEHTMEGKENIPGGWNCQREANNTQRDHGPVKGTIKDIEVIHG